MTEKTCGGCTACCHTIPVPEINIVAYQGCPHECRPPAAKVGCGIYATRPSSCAVWNCQWLAEPEWGDRHRPDRCGVVVDVMLDTFGLRDETTGEIVEKPAMQFWVERGHEDDWLDPDSPVQDLIRSACAHVPGMGVLWRTYDPVHGQSCRAFYVDEQGRSCTCDGGPPTRNARPERERTSLALELIGRARK
jgi:hypothetical protein